MPSSAAAATEAALVAASFGRQFYVRPIAGGWHERVAVTRGKRTDVCVGDRVDVRLIGADQAVIERVHARRNELQRSDEWRSKLLAANLDQVGIVLAGEPPFSEELLVRMLAAIETAGIEPALILNKADLPGAMAAAAARVAVYRALGYRVLEVSARSDPEGARATLGPWLAGRTTLLIGQSGMGKSTLVNALVPDAELVTRSISEALQTGRHTTTFSRMFDVPPAIAADARIVDSPGFQTFGLAHLSVSQLMHAMRDLAPLIGRCRFNDCLHRDEPGCAVREAVGAGAIDSRRYEIWVRIVEEVRRAAAPR